MKKTCVQYLIVTFIISYLCFGALILLQYPFQALFSSPPHLLLFILGCLGPFFGTVFVFVKNKEEFHSLKGLLAQMKTLPEPKSWILVLLFLFLHYVLAIILRVVGGYGSFFNFLKYIPIMLLLFGSQEIGWRFIIQPAFEETKGFWRSGIITGLLCSVWFLPLFFIPQFIINSDFYLQFTAYIIGFGLLSTTIFKQTKNILCCIVFSALFYALSVLFSLKQGNILLAVVAVDFFIAVSYNGKLFVKQQ